MNTSQSIKPKKKILNKLKFIDLLSIFLIFI